MRFAFSTLGCPSWDVGHTAAEAARYGYDGVELRLYRGEVIPADLPNGERAAIRSAFQGHGVAICCVSASTRFSSSDAAQRKEQEDVLVQYVDLADSLGAPLVRTFGGLLPDGVSEETAISYVAESLVSVAHRTAGATARIVLETHDAFSSGRTVAAVLRQVPSSRVGALWDTHHPYRTGETAEQTYNLLSDRLLHLHVKDARRSGDGWQLVLLGEGEVPWREVLDVISQRGYDGWVCVEWEKKWHPEIEDPEVAFPQHIRLLKQHVHQA